MLLLIRLAQIPGIPVGAPDYGRVFLNMGFLLLWIIVSVIGFAIAIPVGMWVFNRITPGINEMEELRKGNMAVALVMTATIVAMVLVVVAVILK